MLNVSKLGHAEFKVRDLDRMAEFYKNVIGLTETGREKGPAPRELRCAESAQFTQK
jgi:catechol-2,3-dioxygenase